MSETETFANAYATLNQSVEALRQLPIEDIDQLVGLVEKAAQAHAQCKQRLAQVETLLAAHLISQEESAGGPTLSELFDDF